MGGVTESKKIKECGSISPCGRICNHKEGHDGKCIRVEEGKRGIHVIEYWENSNG